MPAIPRSNREAGVAAQRLGIQLPRARLVAHSKSNDLAREAVNCNAVLGGAVGWRWCFAASGRGIRLIGNYATTPLPSGAPKPQPIVARWSSGHEIAA